MIDTLLYAMVGSITGVLLTRLARRFSKPPYHFYFRLVNELLAQLPFGFFMYLLILPNSVQIDPDWSTRHALFTFLALACHVLCLMRIADQDEKIARLHPNCKGDDCVHLPMTVWIRILGLNLFFSILIAFPGILLITFHAK